MSSYHMQKPPDVDGFASGRTGQPGSVIGATGRICTCDLSLRGRLLYLLSYRGAAALSRALDFNQ